MRDTRIIFSRIPCSPRLAHKEAVRYGAAAFEKREYRGIEEYTAGGIGSFYEEGTNPLALREPRKPVFADRIGEAVLSFGNKPSLSRKRAPSESAAFGGGFCLSK